MSRATFTIATAPQPGAIGIVQLHGLDVRDVIGRLTGRAAAPGRSFLADLGGIDEGVVAILRDDWAQLMPHGGPRVMQKLTQRLRELGAEPLSDPPARLTYPEADSELEADMLATLARAASPAAGWASRASMAAGRHWLASEKADDWPPVPDPRDHLIVPPAVVLIGRANVGKSTLTNLVLGRAASITADLPGTTRDWVSGLAELPTVMGELAVRWFDTPGLRDTGDAIEQRAQHLARDVIEAADVLIAVRDPETDWPPLPARRRPDVWLVNKCDLPHFRISNPHSEIPISAQTGQGLEALAGAITRVLGLDAAPRSRPWAFSEPLRHITGHHNRQALARYSARAPTRAADPPASPIRP